MNRYLMWGQIGIAIVTFIRSLIMIFNPTKVISSKRLSLLPKEKIKIYSTQHGIVLMELSLLFLVMTLIEPMFVDISSYLYITIYLLALIILFLKLYALDSKYFSN